MKTVIVALILLLNYGIVTTGEAAMSTGMSLTEYVIKHEGYNPNAYSDIKQTSIGHGLSLEWCKKKGWKGSINASGRRSLSYMDTRDAMYYLNLRLAEDRKHLRRLIPTYDSLPTTVRFALQSAYYNAQTYIGPNIRHFAKKRMLSCLAFELAYDHNPTKDPKIKPDVALALCNRRVSEGNSIVLSMGLAPFPKLKSLAEFRKEKANWQAYKKRAKLGAKYGK